MLHPPPVQKNGFYRVPKQLVPFVQRALYLSKKMNRVAPKDVFYFKFDNVML